ncbi:MAG: COG1470 family protein [Candidatus Heimdallarchaeota archaeon]
MKKVSLVVVVCMFLIPLACAVPDYTVDLNLENVPISSNQNSSLGYFTLSAINESISNVFFQESFILPISFSPQNIALLQNQTQRVNISVETIAVTSPGNYSGRVSIFSDNGPQKQFDLNVEVQKNSNFVVSSSDFITTLDSGLNGILGNITIKNTGNVNQLFSIYLNGTISELIKTTEQVLVYKGNSETFSITYSIPKDQELKQYGGELIVVSDQNSTNQSINLSMNIRDVISPQIISANFSDVMSTLTNTLQVEAIDNVAIANVTAEIYYYKEEGNETVRHTLKNITFDKVIDRDRWDYDFNETETIRYYYIDVYVRDTTNNLNLTTRQFHVTALKSLNHETVIKFPAVKYGDFTSIVGFNIKYETPVKVSIGSLEYNYTWEFAIERPDGKKRYFEKGDNAKTFSDVGNYTLMLKGEKEGEFYGTILFEVIDTHEPVDLLEFSGQFMNCTIPKEFIDRNFYGGTLELELQDGATCGNNSFYRYIIQYPIDSYVEGEHKYIVSSKGEAEKEQNYAKEIGRKNSAISKRTASLWILSIVFLITVFWTVYNMKVKPYIYWRR